MIRPVHALLLAGAVSVAAAQPTAVRDTRLKSGAANLNGVWDVPYVPDMTLTATNQRGTSELPFTPEGLAEWKSYDAADGDYTGSCMPFGFSRSFNAPYPFQIVQTDTHVAFLFEINTWFHVVEIGASHPADLDPTWFGHSIGKWDGETLVIDTIGFNGWTRLDTVGHPHSDKLHLVQTLRRNERDQLVYTTTIDDPKFYTRPWTNERIFTRSKGGLMEYSCQENNKDLRDGLIKMWIPPPARKPK